MRIDPRVAGAAIGLWLGFIWVLWSFEDTVLVGLVGVVGYLIGRFVAGDLDVSHITRRFDQGGR
jgi:hypothetical protein